MAIDAKEGTGRVARKGNRCVMKYVGTRMRFEARSRSCVWHEKDD